MGGWFNPSSWLGRKNDDDNKEHEQDAAAAEPFFALPGTTERKQEESPSYSKQLETFLEGYIHVTPESRKQWDELQSLSSSTGILTVMGGAAVISFAVGFRLGRLNAGNHAPWRVYTDVRDIPKSYFERNIWLRGRVITVSDGDTLRVRHTPFLWDLSNGRLSEGQKVSEHALPIRICGIDTPETAKFGKPGQPFGDKAKEHLQSMVLDRIVHFRMLQQDQYGRGVAEVTVRRWRWFPFVSPIYTDEAMLQAGLAEVYQGSGAVYGRKGKDAYLKMQEAAKAAKKGMWSQKDRESAAEYKAKHK